MNEGAPAGAGLGPGHAWNQSAWFWDAFYGAVLAVTLGALLAGPGPRGLGTGMAALSLLAMGGWYLVLGRRVLREPSGGGRESLYLAGQVALLVVATTQSGFSAYILIALVPQCFLASAGLTTAVAWVTVANLVPVISVFTTDHSAGRGRALAESAAVAGLSIAFSVAFGTWITGIIEQSITRADLIAQLEAAQAQLAEANREAGMLAERQRLASEIHDTLAQGFTSIVMLLQAAEPEVGHDDGQVRRYLARAASTARENLDEARGLVAALTPAHLQSGSLEAALRRLAERDGDGPPATFEVTGTGRPLAAGTEVVLLRVCQEALANVRKHAQASRVRVVLDYAGGAVRLEISDDGAGFDPERALGGYGLRGMRGRVADGGGTLNVRSTPGGGTSVRVEVPA